MDENKDENKKVASEDKPHGDFDGHVVAGKLMDYWGLSLKESAKLLGYESESDVKDYLTGRAGFQRPDAKVRIIQLFEIHGGLLRLFQNRAVENEWLREPNDFIDGKIPLDIMLNGSLEDVMFVNQFIAHISGR